MKDGVKRIIKPILGYGLVAIFILAIISVMAILNGSIMRIFGFQYKSVGSVILYFIIVTIVGFPIETFTEAFPKALISLGKIEVKAGRLLFIVLDTIGSGIVMALVDYFMDSVAIADLSILIISFIMAILSSEREKN